ncbi:MAG TPA: Rab family GTPase [Candidatus Baltobacteraceae bacterium]|nr:Rab family GTPase [Candidatus Baltobacteraceae bacterium]
MLQKNICMLGSFAVGKTSLVRRYVESIYSDTYHTTVGVKIDKKMVQVGSQEVTLILWDLYGEDEFQKMRWSYVKGASGYLLVADGTRRATFEKALMLEEGVRDAVGALPFIFVLNKADLASVWEIDAAMESGLVDKGWEVMRASAKTGENVDAAFRKLTEKMLGA